MKKPYILAADDEPMNLMILKEMLLDEQYELVCVDDGAKCVESVKNRRPDLILMDVSMPVMDGLEACRRIKMFEACADLPIVLVSSLASDSEVDKGMDAAADYYITKPFNDDELLDVFSRYLGR